MGAGVQELKHAARVQECSVRVAVPQQRDWSKGLVQGARHSAENVLQLGAANR